MSVKKWHQLAEEKSVVDQQTQDIHQKFKMNKISKEFGQLSGEELFKPITKRLDEKSSATAEEEEQEGPVYTMDEFDEINPFGDEFRPDAPTPAPTPPPSPEPTSSPPYDDGDDFPLPPPPLMEETSKRAKLGQVEPKYPHESTLLQTVNQLITKFGNDPNYTIGKSKLGLEGKTIAELKKIRDGINEKRRATQPLSKQLEQGKQSLRPTPQRKSKESLLPTSFEKKIMSRRPFVEPSDDEEDFPEQDWETEKSGLDSVEKLIDQLHLSLGSIKAGNNSIKLKNQVLSLLDSLVELGTIDKKQKKKIITNYILQ